MPAKTKRDEEKWQKAKEIAEKAGKGENYAYIMGIYKKMKPDYEFKTGPAAKESSLENSLARLAREVPEIRRYIIPLLRRKEQIPGELARGKTPGDFDRKTLEKETPVEDPDYYDKLEAVKVRKPDLKHCLLNLLAVLRALQWIHWTAHWKSKGSNYYGDHLLFERLYVGDGDGGSPIDEIDALGEKIVEQFGSDAIDPAAVAQTETDIIRIWMRQSNPIRRALLAETTLQKTINQLFAEQRENLSPGMDDYLAALANAHETNMYLLKQRLTA